MEPSVVGAPQTAEIETPAPSCAPKKPGTGVFCTTAKRRASLEHRNVDMKFDLTFALAICGLGLEIAPDLAVGDGALGFWKAIEEVFPSTRQQRCWVHKTANILNKVARSVQVNMKSDLREIYGAPTRAAAEMAINVFADKYGAKYDKAVACLTKDRETLLAFFDFPAEHWDHLRTSPSGDLTVVWNAR
jgi:transposase-like protein